MPLTPRRKLLYVVIADVVVLALLEGVARLLLPASVPRFDAFSALTIELGLPSLATGLRPDRELFWSLQPSLPPTRVEGRIGPRDHVRFTFSTTDEGFRSTPGSPAAAPEVIALGDSCTFGVGVDDAETIPSRLQAGLGASRRVVNAAVPGYSAFQGRELLESRLSRTRPAAVVATFGWNDSASWDGRSDREHAVLLARPRPLWQRSRLVQLIALLVPRRERVEDAKPAADRPRLTPEEFAGELRGIVAWARARNARPVLVVWPARHHLEGVRLLPHQDVTRQVARETGATLVDLFPPFREQGGASLYVDAVHTNPRGCEVAAREIAAALSEAR